MNSIDVIRTTIAQHGVGGMWRGMGVTMARDSLGCGCFFWAMAWTQQHCKSNNYGWSDLNVNLLSGAMAGLAFWAVAIPLDTLKTWIQTGATDSAMNAVRLSYQQRGIMGTAQQLTRGWQVAFGRGAPSAAITVVTYEYCYKYWQK
jgi:solute carrier family 25 carnitine/acylcarnitine transporter 20/29